MNMSNMTKYVLVFTIGTLVGYYGLPKVIYTATPQSNNQPQQVATTSSLSAAQKASPNDPDLIVTQKYVANINGKKVEVPIVAKTAPTSPATTGTGISTTATLKQEIDVSPLVAHMIPKWEVGIGVGTQKDKGIYIPLSIQRNYEVSKGVQFEIHLDTSGKIVGTEIQHKWRF